MNYKQALVASKLGMKLTRPSWNGGWVRNINESDNGVVRCINEKGNTISLIGEAFTCDDWEICHEPETGTSST